MHGPHAFHAHCLVLAARARHQVASLYFSRKHNLNLDALQRSMNAGNAAFGAGAGALEGGKRQPKREYELGDLVK